MDQGTVTILASLIAIISSVVAATMTLNTKTQGLLVAALQNQVVSGEKREAERVATCEARNDKLIADNRTNAQTTFSLVSAIDKLGDEQARTNQAIGDFVHGRNTPRSR